MPSPITDQQNLFGEPALPGFTSADEVISATEERALIERIDAVPLKPFRFQQRTGKRLTHSFGWSYDFQTGAFGPAEPIPDWLESLKVSAASFARLRPADLVQALLIRYDPGAGIGWHRDRPVFEHVVGVSLGAPASMRFRRRSGRLFERATVALHPRSIYGLTGEARHDWEHSIAPMDLPRWSVTFRTLRALDHA